MNLNKYMNNLFKSIFILLGSNVFYEVAYAIDYSYAMNVGYEDSTNLRQVINGEDGQAQSVGLVFDLSSNLKREWDLNLNGNFEITDFSENIQTQQIKGLQALGIYKPLESNFVLVSLIDVSQIPINRFQTQDVNNIRDQYAYAFKPSYYLSLTPTDKINFEYTFVDFNLEDIATTQIALNSSNVNNSVLVNYEKQINATNNITINLRTGNTDFDTLSLQGAIDYDQDDLFVRWLVVNTTNQFQFEYGFSKITDELNRKFDQAHKLFSFTRQINQANSFSLDYSDRFNNALNDNRATNTIAINQLNNLTTAQSLEQYSINYTIDKNYFTANLGLSDVKLVQVGTQNTEDRMALNFGATYILSRFLEESGRSNLQLNYSRSESDFDTTLTNFISNEVEIFNLTFNYVYSSNIIFSLGYNVRNVNQLDNSFTASSIDSKGIMFSFTYSDRGKI